MARNMVMRGRRLVDEDEAQKYRAKRDRKQQQRNVSHRDVAQETPRDQGSETERTYRPRLIEDGVKAMTKAQGRYMASIMANQLTFAVGCPGTGKTHIAAGMAARLLEMKRVERIVLSRPAVEAGRGLGFLPGDMKEKYAPWAAPFMTELTKYLGASHVELLVKRERLIISPLEFMQGLTFEDDFVVLDEAENTTPGEMKMFLTRIGQNAKVVADGDLGQTQLGSSLNGLQDALNRLDGCPDVGLVEFGESDIVRSGLVGEIVKRYR